MTRRKWLAVAGGSAAALASSGMKLSLSVRVAEAAGSKEKTLMGMPEFVALAKKHGYEAICMRASQAGVQTPMEKVREIRRRIDASGLKVSMATGDIPIVANDENGPNCLRKITPYLDLAEALGANLMRICMKKAEDIPFAQRAVDEARERRIRLAHQSHHASLFETVDGSVETLKKINRPNFGIIYEPANWFAADQDYGPKSIQRIRPWLMNVYLQNHRINPNGKALVATWSRGRVNIDHIGLWEKGGVDFDRVFEGLYSIGYKGYVTVHQAFAEIMTPEEAAEKSYRYLKPFMK